MQPNLTENIKSQKTFINVPNNDEDIFSCIRKLIAKFFMP